MPSVDLSREERIRLNEEKQQAEKHARRIAEARAIEGAKEFAVRFVDSEVTFAGLNDSKELDYYAAVVSVKKFVSPEVVAKIDAKLADFGSQIPGYTEAHKICVSQNADALTPEVVSVLAACPKILLVRSWTAGVGVAYTDRQMAFAEKMHRLLARHILAAFSVESP